MKFSSRLLSSVVMSSLLLGGQLFADESSSEDSQREEVRSAQASVDEERGELARTTVRIKELRKTLDCATKLVEYQFNGQESAMRGLDMMSTIMDRIANKDYRYKDLKKECRSIYKNYKKDVRKHRAEMQVLTGKSQESYMAAVEEKYASKPGLIRIAKQAMNPQVECHKIAGSDIKVGALLAFSMGWDHYSCRTPLGKKISQCWTSFWFRFRFRC